MQREQQKILLMKQIHSVTSHLVFVANTSFLRNLQRIEMCFICDERNLQECSHLLNRAFHTFQRVHYDRMIQLPNAEASENFPY